MKRTIPVLALVVTALSLVACSNVSIVQTAKPVATSSDEICVAFSAQSLLSAQVEARDDMVSAMLGTLREEAALARRMSMTNEFTAVAGQAAHLLAQSSELEDHARQLAHWQRDRTGLVDPEPAANVDLQPPVLALNA